MGVDIYPDIAFNLKTTLLLTRKHLIFLSVIMLSHRQHILLCCDDRTLQ